MNLKHIILPSAALGGVAALLLPSMSGAFSVIGGSLSTTQRDVRVFNNWTGTTPNNNTTPDTNFPGYDGAEMAVWKGIVEWGSRLHGTGNGDPHQPAGLGSGGANFDAFWSGNATGVGSTNDNIVSANTACSSGVLAFTETPISDGWRILFCTGWTWEDGPGTSMPGSNIDIQGVLTHEFGHALGLGHSAVGTATMFPTINGTGIGARSIDTDDINGVRSIYGVAAATKPIITAVNVSLGNVTITGSNFLPTGNQVWFTSNVATGGTSPLVTVSNLNSNGTQITCTPPSNAGSGDIIVKVTGTANNTISNAWPVDMTSSSCPLPTSFCFSASNSYSPTGALIGYYGTTSVAANDLHLVTQDIPPGKLTIHLYSQVQIAPVAFGDGARCIGNPFYRIYPAQNADFFGSVDMPIDLNALPAAGQISPGQTWGFMAWYRDPPNGGAGYNGSDALSTTWCP